MTQQTSGVGIWISGIETCNYKQGTDKDQVFFLGEVRNKTLELKKRIKEVQESKFQSSGMGVFTTYKLEDEVQELIFGVQELNKIHHLLKRYELLCP